MELTRSAALACTVALALSGCSATQEVSTSTDATPNSRPSSPPLSSTSSSTSSPSGARTGSETSGPEPEDSTRAFGEYATYGDGLLVNVSEPKAFRPSRYASFEEAPAYVRFTVTIVNRTGSTFDPTLVYASLQSANEEAGAVFDSEQGLEPGPFTKLLRGSAVKWDIGFGVQDPKDLVMEITPGGFHSYPVTYSTGR